MRIQASVLSRITRAAGRVWRDDLCRPRPAVVLRAALRAGSLASLDCAVRESKKKMGFTLIELLVAAVVTMLIVVLLLQALGFASSHWRRTSGSAQAFEGARVAFDALTRSLSQATLATEYDYYNTNRVARLTLTSMTDLQNFKPDRYGRYSSLHFLSGKSLPGVGGHTHAIFFQAPMQFATNAPNAPDLPAAGVLNAVGFFVRRSDDSSNRPPNLSPSAPTPRDRLRLMVCLQPTENLDVYRDGTGSVWVQQAVTNSAHILAENVLALVVLPKFPDAQGKPLDALAPGYEYNSRTNWFSGNQPLPMHQLPPIVRVVMVAIDEATALRKPDLGDGFAALFSDPNDFTNNLATVEQALRDERANYRIFQADVLIRAAKWSE